MARSSDPRSTLSAAATVRAVRSSTLSHLPGRCSRLQVSRSIPLPAPARRVPPNRSLLSNRNGHSRRHATYLMRRTRSNRRAIGQSSIVVTEGNGRLLSWRERGEGGSHMFSGPHTAFLALSLYPGSGQNQVRSGAALQPHTASSPTPPGRARSALSQQP